MTMAIERGWKAHLSEEFKKPYIDHLKSFIEERRRGGAAVFPPLPEVFSALKYTPFDKVKVVIVGQDPYHGPGQAHGLSFSVKKGVKIPPSLQNIYKELKSDLGVKTPNHGCLTSWAMQGVLLLNATLTVERGSPKSHYGRGWERFTDAIIESLCKREEGMIFLLWGRSAQEKCEKVLNTMKHHHKVYIAAHPSPYSASGFFGCKHFSKANEDLIKWGKDPIDWRIPD